MLGLVVSRPVNHGRLRNQCGGHHRVGGIFHIMESASTVLSLEVNRTRSTPASIAAIVLRSNLYSARVPVKIAIVRESVGICGEFYQRRQHESIHSGSLAR